MLIHATSLVLGGSGVLLRGPSGAGKSDLALRAIEAGAVLVGDDQVRLEAVGRRLWVYALAHSGGRIEVRGIGIANVANVPAAPLGLVADLAGPGETPDRLPEPADERLLGIDVPRVLIRPFEASAVAKLRHAVRLAAGAAGVGTPILITSFSYRVGIPEGAHCAFDVRFLSDPDDRPELRPLSGLDAAVRRHILRDGAFAPFLVRAAAVIGTMSAANVGGGGEGLGVAVGCEGGRHRSVGVAVELGRVLRDRGHGVTLAHRDLGGICATATERRDAP